MTRAASPRSREPEVNRVFRALADPTRRALLDVLSHHPEGISASRLAEFAPKISRPAVSRHLGVLAGAGLAAVDRRGRERIYRLDRRGFQAAYENWFARYADYWRGKLSDLKRYVEEEATRG